MTGEDKHFNRQRQGLYSQNVGIGVGEAFSAGEYAIKPIWVQRLQGDCNGARLGSVLNESQLKNYPR